MAINAILFSLIIGFYCEERWRGEREWEKYRAEAKARGIKLTLAEMIPPPIPDEQNFAAIPVFQDLFDTNSTSAEPFRLPIPQPGTNRYYQAPLNLVAWRDAFITEGLLTNTTDNAARDILEGMKVFDAALGQLRAAASRPDGRFPVDYSKGASTQFPHFSSCMKLARLLRLRIAATLACGEGGQAFDDLMLGLRVYRALEKDACMIGGLVGIAILALFENAAQEGMSSGQWSPKQIEAIRKALEDMSLVANCAFALQGERASANSMMEELIEWKDPEVGNLVFFSLSSAGSKAEAALYALYPRGWYRLNQLSINKFYDAQIARIDSRAGRISAAPTADKTLRDLGCSGAIGKLFYFVVNMLTPATDGAIRKFANVAARVRMAETTCSLELFRIARGRYPENLDELVPEFVAKLPIDPVEGKPVRYERQSDGGFVLWSVDLERRFPELAATNAPPLATNTTYYAGYGSSDPEQWTWRQPGR